MRGSRKFFQRSPTSLFFFFCSRKGDQIPLKAGHHWPASETPFKWRFAVVSMMIKYCWLGMIFQGIRTSITKKKKLYFYDFSGKGPNPQPHPSGSAHAFHLGLPSLSLSHASRLIIFGLRIKSYHIELT